MVLNSLVISLLTVDVGLYLPPYKTINIYFVKDILARRKKAIKNADVSHLYVPQYESLTIPKMLEFAMRHEGLADYFPHPRDIPALPRQVSGNFGQFRIAEQNLFVFFFI